MIYHRGVQDTGKPVIIKNPDGSYWTCPYYQVWHAMMARCYSETYLRKKPAYRGTEVCEEWLTFSNFKSWMISQNWQGMQLDKDLKQQGSKIYSPQTCCFIPGDVNNFILDAKSARGEWPLGVYWNKTNEKFFARVSIAGKQKHLGSFDCPKEAHRAWKKKKLELAIDLATKLPVELQPHLINRYKEEIQ